MANIIKNFFNKKKEKLTDKFKSLFETPQITSYKIRGNKIIVKKGVFNRSKEDYSEERVKELNEEIENQYNSIDPKELDEKNMSWELNFYSFAIGIIFFSIINATLLTSLPLLSTIAVLGIVGCSFGTIYNAIKCVRSAVCLNRFNKISFIKDNKEELNKEINNEKTDEEVKEKLNNVGPITKAVILREKHKNKEVFDISTINNMSLEGLRQLRDNLEALKEEQNIEEVQNTNGPKLILK